MQMGDTRMEGSRPAAAQGFSAAERQRVKSIISKAETKTIYLSYLIYVNAQTSLAGSAGRAVALNGRAAHALDQLRAAPWRGPPHAKLIRTF